MPEADKIHATGVAFLGCGKYFIRLHVEETEAHRAVTHDAFEVSSSPAAAVGLFGVERHDRVPTLPHARDVWITAESDAVADRPDAHQARSILRNSQPGGHRIRIIQGLHRGHNPLRLEDGGQRFSALRTL